MKMHPPGRPREFTYKLRQDVIFHVHQGATVEEAAQIVGVSLRTVQREAKHNDDFHHDLHLSLHTAHVDPEKLVQRAARTHWRAAAWLLERTDPDRYGKRPPNSCRPETLQEMNDWLIETALESTPPEHRTAVYRRMRNVADKAFEILMPDQHDSRRRLIGSLPEREMPLSSHEWGKTMEPIVSHYPEPSIAAKLSTDSSGRLPSPNEETRELQETRERQENRSAASVNRIPARLGPTPYNPTDVGDPIGFFRAQPPREQTDYRAEGNDGFRFRDSDRLDADEFYSPAELEIDDPPEPESAKAHRNSAAGNGATPGPAGHEPVADTSACQANASHADQDEAPAATDESHPPDEGIMSPKKTHSATSPSDKANAAATNDATSSAAERLRDPWEWRFRRTATSPG